MAVIDLTSSPAYNKAYDLGAGLSQGLNMLAQHKMGQLSQQQQQQVTARNLAMLGLSPEAAWGLAGLPPEVQKNALQEYFAWQGIGGQGGALGGMQPQQPGAPAEQAGRPGMQQPQGMPMGSKARAEQMKQRVQAHKEQSEIEKLERPYYQKTVDQYKSSHDAIKDVDRLINLVQKGKIVNPTEDHMQRWASQVLKINLKDLRGADTEEFEKITAGFLKNAKNWFGSRVTNYDLEQFLKTVPSLSMSHEGKLRLLGSMKAAAQAQQLQYKALREIMKENGGRLPRYAQVQVEERIAPELDKLAQEFTTGSNIPALSEEAKAGEKRNAWMRPAKAGVTGALQLPTSGIPGAGLGYDALKSGGSALLNLLGKFV